MKAFIAIIAVLALGSLYMVSQTTSPAVESNLLRAEFMSYITEHSKNYNSEAEFNFRFQLYTETDLEISTHNAGSHTYVRGHNHMSDWTQDEYNVLLGYRSLSAERKAEIPVASFPETSDPEWSWIEQGAVTPVKDQGSCGSCWAFSAVAALEQVDWLWNDDLESLSEQQLVDCAVGKEYESNGCEGGEMTGAFKYYHEEVATLEDEYVYHAKDETCNKQIIRDTLSHQD